MAKDREFWFLNCRISSVLLLLVLLVGNIVYYGVGSKAIVGNGMILLYC